MQTLALQEEEESFDDNAPFIEPVDEAADADSRAFAVAMAEVGWETKAEQVRVLHVAPLVSWCSYMVVLNIKSRPQLQAILAKMERLAEQQYQRKLDPNAMTSRSDLLRLPVSAVWDNSGRQGCIVLER